jgi:hypothetical protein
VIDAVHPRTPARWSGLIVAVVFWVVLTALMWDLINAVAAVGVGAAGVVQVVFLTVRGIRGTTGPGLPKNAGPPAPH